MSAGRACGPALIYSITIWFALQLHRLSANSRTTVLKRSYFLQCRCKLKSSLFGAAVFLLLGCARPAVESFQITPQVLCEGESAVANWDVRGNASMTFLAEPERAGKQTRKASGKQAF